MYTNTIALAGLFAAFASAIPMAAHQKRDIVWVTEIEEDIVTVPVTVTVWVEATPTHFGHQHGAHRTSSVEVPAPSAAAPPPAAAAPAPSSETSSYVAPVPTTTSSAYVAPTTSTSVYVAPEVTTSAWVAPTTSVYVAPTTTTTPYVAPVASTTAAAAPAASSATSNTGSGLSSGMGTSGTSYMGDLTYFTPGMGACGQVSTESDKMVAISEKIFDSYLAQAGGNPNNNPLCGKFITIVGTDGSPFQAQIYDRCPGCDEGSLDLPEAFFNSVTYNPATGASGDGRVKGVKWSFN